MANVHDPAGNNLYGIDMGSDTLKLYGVKNDRLMVEKNMIAVQNDGRVIALGDLAYEMYQKNPANIDVRSTVKDGRISDIERAGFLLKKLLARVDSLNALKAPTLFFAVPINMSRIEERAYADSAWEVSGRKAKTMLVDRGLCDAISTGIHIFKTKGSVVMNIGAESTEISVIAQGQIVINDSINTGGTFIDESICDIVRRRNNMIIGIRTADRLKKAMADCNRSIDARKTYGMDTISGMPREVIVSSTEINDAVLEHANIIAEGLGRFIGRVPPQIAEFVREEGIYLTGGSSKLKGIGDYLHKKTGVIINSPEDAALSTIKGLKDVIRQKRLHVLARPVED